MTRDWISPGRCETAPGKGPPISVVRSTGHPASVATPALPRHRKDPAVGATRRKTRRLPGRPPGSATRPDPLYPAGFLCQDAAPWPVDGPVRGLHRHDTGPGGRSPGPGRPSPRASGSAGGSARNLVATHAERFGIKRMCRVLRVSPSGHGDQWLCPASVVGIRSRRVAGRPPRSRRRPRGHTVVRHRLVLSSWFVRIRVAMPWCRAAAGELCGLRSACSRKQVRNSSAMPARG